MAKDLDDGFDDVEEPEDLEVVGLEGLEDLDEDTLEGEAEEAEEEQAEAEDLDEDAETEEEEEEDEELDFDDVEAGLDVILKDRLVAVEEEEEEEDEEEPPDPEERAEGATKVVPKRPDEFVCQSCFLFKHFSQLADAERRLCLDCV